MDATVSSPPALTALVYDDGAAIEPVLARLVADLRARAYRLAGYLQHDRARPDRPRCDMDLENLATGEFLRISEDRGAAARGCRLDRDAMAAASQACATALRAGVDVLILNKFGKTEAAGEGFRELLALALGLNAPVVIGVPRNNLAAWAEFAQGLDARAEANALPAGDLAGALGFPHKPAAR